MNAATSPAISSKLMVSAQGERPWLRRSSANTRCVVASSLAMLVQLRAEPKSPCRITTGGPASPKPS